MSLWIKICGNTSLKDTLLAAHAGADAVGFVFAPSPRQVSVDQVAAIVPHLPAQLEKIGVFVDASVEEILTAVRLCGLTGVQLHSDAGEELTASLRTQFAGKILRVVHFGSEAAAQAEAIAHDHNVDAILVDSRTAKAVGGTGVTFDWSEARRTLFVADRARKPLIAAGGMKPSNVAEAIATLAPWGVDVASGVEASPGHKDPAKISNFIAQARMQK